MQNIANPAVSVIVVNWNGAACLPRCLSSLRAQTYKNFELILVDNASTDGSLQFAETSWPDIVVARQSENTGFARGNNIGAALAKGQWLALLNSDAFPEERWLENLLKAADERPRGWFFTSCQIQANSPTLLDGTGDEVYVSGLATRRHYGEPVENASRIADEVFSACGAAAMYPRQAFLDAGGFDEDFFAYLEDVDLSFRLRLQGYRCLHVPDARVFHIGSASKGKESEFAIYHSQRNMVWLYLKNMPAPLFRKYAVHHVGANLAFFLFYSFCCCPCIMLRAKWDALRGLPRFLAKRKIIQQSLKIQPADLVGLLKAPRQQTTSWRGWFLLIPRLAVKFFIAVRTCRRARRVDTSIKNAPADRRKPGILFIEDRIPNPALGAGYPRAKKILHELAAGGYRITFYPFIVNDEPAADADAFLPAGTEYLSVLSPHDVKAFLTARRGQYDCVWVSRPHNMRRLLEQIPDPAEWKTLVPYLIYDAEAVFSLREKVRAQVLGLTFDDSQLVQEKSLVERAQRIVAVSPQEADFFASAAVPVDVLVHTVDMNPTPATFDDRAGFLFIGPIVNNQTPNADALFYLLTDIWPRIKMLLPQATLTIVGANDVLEEFQPHLTDATVCLGQITDQELFDCANRARVHIVPTRFAAGVPLKAMTLGALGLPMVATLLIQEQLGWTRGELVPADWKNAGSFADACIRLHEDRGLWESVRTKSLAAVRQLSSPDRFTAALREIIKSRLKNNLEPPMNADERRSDQRT